MDLAKLSIQEKVGQLLFIGLPGDSIDASTRSLLEDVKPGGICLFARNIKSPAQVRGLNDEVRELLSIEPFLSIDQEGGLVDRLRRILAPMPAASQIATVADAAAEASVIAQALRILGFNMDFAPVVDVIDADRERFQNGLHSRSYGKNADDVIALAGEFLRVLEAGGIVGCIKHFPGLGASEVDSHEELPIVPVHQNEFEEVDLKPYRSLISERGVKAVMVAHAVYPNLTLQEKGQDGKLLPSSLSSSIVTRLLRQEIGFDGLVLTDDLEMGAIVKNYGIGEASTMAVLAGHDMVCICAGIDSIHEAHSAISAALASGKISIERVNASVKRILRLKSELQIHIEFDPDRLASLSDDVAQLTQRSA